MRISCLTICLLALTNGIVVSAEKAFTPYEAIVDVEEGANVWSGPDLKKHYPTMRLSKGEKVNVLRHDFGGWCMIEPPKGSHSWIRAEYVDRDGANRGFVNANRVKVHVGSEVKPENIYTYLAELSKDDVVEILGEKEFIFDDVPRRMLKISPVKREWRWIKRKSIVAVDSIKSEPFPGEQSTPKKPSGPVAVGDWDVVTRPVSVETTKEDDQAESAAQSREVNRNETTRNQQPGKQRLIEIDKEFREMVKTNKETWNLDLLEEQYQQLEEDIGQPWMTTEVARRLDAVKRYRKTYNEYIEFLKITTEAKQRDAQLLAQQSQFASQLTTRPIAGKPESPIANQPVASSQSQGLAQPGAAPAFDGAGIVKKLAQSFPGGPQYVLLSPDGKALTFLQPAQGVDLNRYDGRAMGITGQRMRREDWGSDLIIVRNLQPVQLRGAR